MLSDDDRTIRRLALEVRISMLEGGPEYLAEVATLRVRHQRLRADVRYWLTVWRNGEVTPPEALSHIRTLIKEAPHVPE